MSNTSTVTPKLGLVKPTKSDNYDVGIFNRNADKIDDAVAQTKRAIAEVAAKCAALTGVVIDENSPRATLPNTLSPNTIYLVGTGSPYEMWLSIGGIPRSIGSTDLNMEALVAAITENIQAYLADLRNDIILAKTSIQTLESAIEGLDISGDGLNNVWFATSTTPGATAAKVITLRAGQRDFVRQIGTQVIVHFSQANSAEQPTMNIGNTGVGNTRHAGANIGGTGLWQANQWVKFVWDGTGWTITNPMIRTAMIQDLAVTNAKIANNTIQGGKLTDSAIETRHIAAAAVGTTHLSAEVIEAISGGGDGVPAKAALITESTGETIEVAQRRQDTEITALQADVQATQDIATAAKIAAGNAESSAVAAKSAATEAQTAASTAKTSASDAYAAAQAAKNAVADHNHGSDGIRPDTIEESHLNQALRDAIAAAGTDGRQVQIQATQTHIQWQHVGDATWINLVALSTLKGADGRAPQLQVSGTWLQYRFDDSAWANLFNLSTLGGGGGAGNTWFGSCVTPPDINVKVVTLADGQPPLELISGRTRLTVHFGFAQGFQIPVPLSVQQGEDAFVGTVQISGNPFIHSYLWSANRIIEFVWNGDGWEIMNPRINGNLLTSNITLPGTPRAGLGPATTANGNELATTAWVRALGGGGLSIITGSYIGDGNQDHTIFFTAVPKMIIIQPADSPWWHIMLQPIFPGQLTTTAHCDNFGGHHNINLWWTASSVHLSFSWMGGIGPATNIDSIEYKYAMFM